MTAMSDIASVLAAIEESSSTYPGEQIAIQEGESELAFLARKFAEIAENPGFGFAITRKTLEDMGVDTAILSAIPTPPDNVLLWLDPKTENIVVSSLPKGMDVFGLLEKAKE